MKLSVRKYKRIYFFQFFSQYLYTSLIMIQKKSINSYDAMIKSEHQQTHFSLVNKSNLTFDNFFIKIFSSEYVIDMMFLK